LSWSQMGIYSNSLKNPYYIYIMLQCPNFLVCH